MSEILVEVTTVTGRRKHLATLHAPYTLCGQMGDDHVHMVEGASDWPLCRTCARIKADMT